MDKIDYSDQHKLGYFNIYNPEYTCLGKMTDNIAIFQYLDDDYMQIDVIDTSRPERGNKDKMRRIMEIELCLSHRQAWCVTMVTTESAYKGFGVAAEVYRWLLQVIPCLVLQAGDSQSIGGRAIWHSLAGMDDVLVYGKSFNTDFTVCVQADVDREIVALNGAPIYDTGDTFTAFAYYSPVRKQA